MPAGFYESEVPAAIAAVTRPMVVLLPAARRLIEVSALENYPREAIGILLGDQVKVEGSLRVRWWITSAWQHASTEVRTTHRVIVDDPAESQACSTLGPWVLGWWHSHPDDTPLASDNDITVHADPRQLGVTRDLMLIVGITDAPTAPKYHWRAYRRSGAKVVETRLVL